MSSESKRRPLGPGAEEKQKQQERSRRTIRRVLHCIDKYRAAVLLSLLLAVVTVALTLYVPILTGQAVDRIVSQGLVDYEGLVRILAKILAAMALTAVSQWLMNHINNIITYRVVKEIGGLPCEAVFTMWSGCPCAILTPIRPGILSAGLWRMWTSFPRACSWALPSFLPGL